MKKILSVLFWALVSGAASGQTFPVNNLVVNGTSTFTGAMSGAGINALFASPSFTGLSHFTNTSAGASIFELTGNGATTPNKFVGVLNGAFTLFSSNGSFQLLTLSDTGALFVPSLTTSTAIPITSGGTGSSTATGATSNIQYLQGSTGSVAESVTAKLQQVVNAADFGALCNGSHDDTSAIQAAVNTGFTINISSGTCIVTNAITIATQGQMIVGQGRQRTIIQIPATFNLAAAGVFVATPGQEGPTFRDLQVAFVQPDTTVRANLVAYPPAFLMRSASRFRIQHVRIVEAITGIDLAGGTNSGGATMEDVEMSAFTLGITVDGALDSVRIDQLHFWPFNLTTNQTSIFNDGTAVAVLSGRADDLHITNGLFIASGGAVKLIQTASGNTFGTIVGSDFDTFGGLIVQAGQISVSDCFFSISTTGFTTLVTGGSVMISSSQFQAAGIPATPLLQITGLPGAYLSISTSIFRTSGDETIISDDASSGANTLILTGNMFIAPANGAALVNPLINIGAGGRLTATGNRTADRGAGSGSFITVAADGFHNIIGNSGPGWTYSHPTFTQGVFANNN